MGERDEVMLPHDWEDMQHHFWKVGHGYLELTCDPVMVRWLHAAYCFDHGDPSPYCQMVEKEKDFPASARQLIADISTGVRKPNANVIKGWRPPDTGKSGADITPAQYRWNMLYSYKCGSETLKLLRSGDPLEWVAEAAQEKSLRKVISELSSRGKQWKAIHASLLGLKQRQFDGEVARFNKRFDALPELTSN